MPIYDYRCNQCGGVSEILVRPEVEGEVKCPVCRSQDMEKLISASYIVKTDAEVPGTTCCGRAERCDMPPCSVESVCRRG